MKKSIIAVGAASVALAAMPIVETFATPAQVGSAVSDTVSATLAETCTFTSTGTDRDPADPPTGTTGDYAYSTTVTAGDFATIGSTVMTIKCNKTGGWVLNAIGAGSSTKGVAYMKSGNNVADEDINTGSTFSGTSEWGFKVTTNEGYSGLIQTGYDSFTSIPTAATPIVSSSAATDITTGVTVSPTYKIYMSTSQAAGTYTGKVSYTLMQPAS